jgi:hypothetical protein
MHASYARTYYTLGQRYACSEVACNTLEESKPSKDFVEVCWYGRVMRDEPTGIQAEVCGSLNVNYPELRCI